MMFREMRKKRLINKYLKVRLLTNAQVGKVEAILTKLSDLDPTGYAWWAVALDAYDTNAISNMKHYFLQSYRDKEMKEHLK